MQHRPEHCSVHLIACWRREKSRGDIIKQLHQSRHQTKGYIALSPARRGRRAKSGQIYPPPTHYLTHAGSLLFWAPYLAVPPLCELIVYNLCCVSLCNSVGNLPALGGGPNTGFEIRLKQYEPGICHETIYFNGPLSTTQKSCLQLKGFRWKHWYKPVSTLNNWNSPL